MIKATMDSVQFYQENSKKQLSAGIYEITEYDGEVNYCELNGYGGENWMSAAEWVMRQEEVEKDRLFEDNMDAMDRHYDELDEDIDPDHYNDCGGCAACHLCMSGDV